MCGLPPTTMSLYPYTIIRKKVKLFISVLGSHKRFIYFQTKTLQRECLDSPLLLLSITLQFPTRDWTIIPRITLLPFQRCNQINKKSRRQQCSFSHGISASIIKQSQPSFFRYRRLCQASTSTYTFLQTSLPFLLLPLSRIHHR